VAIERVERLADGLAVVALVRHREVVDARERQRALRRLLRCLRLRLLRVRRGRRPVRSTHAGKYDEAAEGVTVAPWRRAERRRTAMRSRRSCWGSAVWWSFRRSGYSP
jgi:hypothetical protein